MPRCISLWVACCCVHTVFAADPVAGLKVPPGFTITQFAGSELANDITFLHIDSVGRVVVAGNGYVRHLVDSTGQGTADKVVELIPPRAGGTMGLLWEKETLFVVGDGGLKKYMGVDGKAPTSHKPETVLALKASGEHDAHAVRRGPDGSLYWLCGNMAGVTEKTIRGEGSPVKKPVAGGLLKLTDDAKIVHVIADGLRNAYDFDFNLEGDAFTFDSDNERCQGLPWFEPTRFYHITPGGNYGWLNPQHAQTWRRPPYFPDVQPPVFTVGRGSPTGVACYRHEAFPEKYRGGFFFADWTFGKIWFAKPEWKDGRYTGTPEVFLDVSGENGFAPTGVAVCPKTGDLFVSIGGRGTRGAVYRIHANDSKVDAKSIGFATPAKRELAPTTREWRVLAAQLRSLHEQTGEFVDPKAIGTTWEGYSLRTPMDEAVAQSLRKKFLVMYGKLEPLLKREYSRAWAAMGDADPTAVSAILSHPPVPQTTDDLIHDLIVLTRLTAPRTEGMTKTMADWIVSLDGRFVKEGALRDRNWPLRMTEVVVELVKLDPKLSAAISGHPDFGISEHAWLARVPGIDPVACARAFVARWKNTPNYEITAGHIASIGQLPQDEREPILVQLYDRGFHDAAILQLAKLPSEKHRAKYERGLASLQATTVTTSVEALNKLEKSTGEREVVPLIRGLRRFGDAKADTVVRAKIVARLQLLSGESKITETAAWETWFQSKAPELAKQLSSSGYDAAKWKARLADVNWDAGSSERGKQVFANVQCATCHNGGSSAGPSLQGVSKRFSRDDLFTAILDPSRDISPRFRTVRITTAEDKVFEGIVVYEATDGILLQTSADSTVRLAGKEIAGKTPGTQSLMPVGLLDMLNAEEIADLLAYMRSL